MRNLGIALFVAAACFSHMLPAVEPELNWAERFAAYSNDYAKAFSAPNKGRPVEFSLKAGGLISGLFIEASANTVSVDLSPGVTTLSKDQLNSTDACLFFRDVYAKTKAQERVTKEMAQYLKATAAAQEKDKAKYLEQLESKLPALEESLAKHRKSLEYSMIRFNGKIIQVLGNNVLAVDHTKYSFIEDKTVLIQGIGSDLVDDADWSGFVYFDGTQEYMTVMGASKKVYKLTTTEPKDVSALKVKVAEISQQVEKTKAEIKRLKKELNLDPWAMGTAK